ncbi:hypothetical protein GCM10023081_10360 [Arthrobacter ginkgonis]|uniref:Uncharacterized protein n=1 Tax=Arthrobacter ginkgonis TaxID=1630594 RepID=A0ABP7BYT9_9MICC
MERCPCVEFGPILSLVPGKGTPVRGPRRVEPVPARPEGCSKTLRQTPERRKAPTSSALGPPNPRRRAHHGARKGPPGAGRFLAGPCDNEAPALKQGRGFDR